MQPSRFDWRRSASANARVKRKKNEIRPNAPAETAPLNAANAPAIKEDTANYANAPPRKQVDG